MVYHINNLREAVETAKRMLTKEQIDKQKSGQSSASPFMKVNQQNPKKNKSVYFNVIETIHKQGDSIDRLTSLMNELSSKLDRKDNSAQYKPRIHQGRNRGCGQRQNRYGSRDRSYSRERGPYNSGRNRRTIRMAIIMVTEPTDLEMESIKQIIGIMTGPLIEGKILTQIIVKEIEKEV